MDLVKERIKDSNSFSLFSVVFGVGVVSVCTGFLHVSQSFICVLLCSRKVSRPTAIFFFVTKGGQLGVRC